MSGKEQVKSGYMKESEYRSSGPAVRPRDAATLIILRREGNQSRVLMGRRASTHKFMPNKFVFPGGRVDPGDSRIRPNHDLHPAVKKRLCIGCSETRARALGLAAIRETYEETGLILGETETPLIRSRSPHWREFLQHRINPRLDILQLVARAITPPYRNRRFDARFFMADATHLQGEVHERPEGSGELLELHWVSLDKAVDLELPNITRLVLGEVAKRLQNDHGPEVEGPFVHTRHGKHIVDRI